MVVHKITKNTLFMREYLD